MDRFHLGVAAVAEILYCPRNFWYRVVEQAQDSNYHMIEGKEQDDIRNQRLYRHQEEREQWRNIQISSDKYGITGIIDVLESRDGEVYPVEFKKGELKAAINDDVQLCCQAILLEEELQRSIQYGYIYYAASASRRLVEFTPELRSITWQAMERARQIMESQTAPEPVNDERCNGCSLAPRCLPAEISFLYGKGGKPVRPLPAVNLGRTLYVEGYDTFLRKEQQRIVVTKAREKIADIPLAAIDEIIVVGNGSLSSPLIQELLYRQIYVYFLTSGGNLRGWLQPVLNKNIFLRQAQFQRSQEEGFALTLAREVVAGKLNNYRALLQRYRRRSKEELKIAIDELDMIVNEARKAQSKESLLGYEGLGARIWFQSWRYLLREDQPFDFQGRNRRPPRDQVNALLSLGYTLLVKEVLSSLMRVGLDPYLGFFHSNHYGRPALALDMMEEFRPLVADSVVITVLNNRMLGKEHFENRFGGVYLTEEGRKIFFRAFQERLAAEITHPVFRYRISYRRVIELQARFLAKVMTGELQEYKAMVVR
ncbi:CRISPR-associated endonuclease Cas4/Cas1 [Carboxydocella sp. JDF658]|uniref:CRISPR-associated endonuclease Cas4/Cas1 n=1 Tax=Carboxydocella sp. JDF658 TaxID=1926600 RepID=UPI0009ADC0DF|nr:CRISPR-associated endonuclease Cas4/Cas1 [Carboxydocella sp. JDF658]GAW32202.1 hypothetical protein JDF658_19670 [Carboxydocella sp. JDF658]